MKRLVAVLVAFAMLFTLASCGLLGGGSLRDAAAGKDGKADDQQPAQDKKPVFGNSSVVSVVHPEFALKDGFVEKVKQLKDAPEGYIPISKPEEFCKIGLNAAGNYILMADIDLAGQDYSSIAGFTGTLNGNGYTVSNAPTTVFSSIEGGRVENLGVYSNLKDCMAGVVYSLRDGGSLFNCWFDGSITNTDSKLIAGGIGYFTKDSTVVSCYNKADITLHLPDDLVRDEWGVFNNQAICGGVFAEVYENVTVCNSFNEGAIRIDSQSNIPMFVGGIAATVDIGDSDGTNIRFEKCYNAGLLDGRTAAGIVGDAEIMEMYVTLQILECFNVGSFGPHCETSAGITNVIKLDDGSVVIYDCYNANDGVKYGIVGGPVHQNSNGWLSEDLMNAAIWNCFNYAPAEVGITEACKNLETCYYLDTAEDASGDGALFATVKQLTRGEMAKKGSFEAFDFDTVWQMGDDYPVFRQETYDESTIQIYIPEYE